MAQALENTKKYLYAFHTFLLHGFFSNISQYLKLPYAREETTHRLFPISIFGWWFIQEGDLSKRVIYSREWSIQEGGLYS